MPRQVEDILAYSHDYETYIIYIFIKTNSADISSKTKQYYIVFQVMSEGGTNFCHKIALYQLLRMAN